MTGLGTVDRRTMGGLAVAVGLPAVVLLLDSTRGRRLFDEGVPTLDAVGAGRSLMLVAATACLLAALGTVGQDTAGPVWLPRVRLLVVATLAATVGAVTLFLVDPVAFGRLGSEDGVVENLTAALFLVGGVAAMVAAVRTSARLGGLLLGVYGLVMLVSGLEEISYGQRLFGFAGPSALVENNIQGEANLHNIATDATESLFYAAVALLFVLLPWLVHHTPWRRWVGVLAVLAPVDWIILLAAPAVALNHDMWDVVVVQLTVWATLGVLVLLAARRRGRERLLVGAVATVAVVTQLSALLADGWVELHDVTEFKEAFIGLVVAAHGVVLARRAADGADAHVRRRAPVRTPDTPPTGSHRVPPLADPRSRR